MRIVPNHLRAGTAWCPQPTEEGSSQGLGPLFLPGSTDVAPGPCPVRVDTGVARLRV